MTSATNSRSGGEGASHARRRENNESIIDRWVEKEVVGAGAEVADHAIQLGRSALRLGRILNAKISEAVHDQPEITLSVAAGAGFVAGGGLRSHAGRMARTMVGRMAVAWMARKVTQDVNVGGGEGSRSASDEELSAPRH